MTKNAITPHLHQVWISVEQVTVNIFAAAAAVSIGHDALSVRTISSVRTPNTPKLALKLKDEHETKVGYVLLAVHWRPMLVWVTDIISSFCKISNPLGLILMLSIQVFVMRESRERSLHVEKLMF